MTNQVPWNKIILEEFINLALLTKDEEMILRTRIYGWTVREQADKLNMSVSSVNRIIKRIKNKYDDVGSGLFTLKKQGIYEVEYTADITSATVGVASLELEQNGEAVGGTESLYNVATASAYGNVSGATLIQVPCGASYTITLGNNSGLDLSVQNANIIIKKLA